MAVKKLSAVERLRLAQLWVEFARKIDAQVRELNALLYLELSDGRAVYEVLHDLAESGDLPPGAVALFDHVSAGQVFVAACTDAFKADDGEGEPTH